MARLTEAYGPQLEYQMQDTVPGMAHWAGSGPALNMCFQCQHWGFTDVPSGPRYRRAVDGVLKPKRCWLYSRLSQGRIVARGVPAVMASCKHFCLNETPPELIDA